MFTRTSSTLSSPCVGVESFYFLLCDKCLRIVKSRSFRCSTKHKFKVFIWNLSTIDIFGGFGRKLKNSFLYFHIRSQSTSGERKFRDEYVKFDKASKTLDFIAYIFYVLSEDLTLSYTSVLGKGCLRCVNQRFCFLGKTSHIKKCDFDEIWLRLMAYQRRIKYGIFILVSYRSFSLRVGILSNRMENFVRGKRSRWWVEIHEVTGKFKDFDIWQRRGRAEVIDE